MDKPYSVCTSYEEDGAGICLCMGDYPSWIAAMGAVHYALSRHEDKDRLTVSIYYLGVRLWQISDDGEVAYAALAPHRGPSPLRVAA